MGSLAKAIEPKSDQLNSDDLITGPITVKITQVDINESAEQKVVIHYQGDNGKPYKPCKSMTRVMAEIWGGADNGASFVGQSMTLYRDPKVKWAGVEVGGIRISHMTGIDRDTPVVVTQAKGKRQPVIIKPLKVATVTPIAQAPDKAAEWTDKLIAKISTLPHQCAAHEAIAVDAVGKQIHKLHETRPELEKAIYAAIDALPTISAVDDLINRITRAASLDDAVDIMAEPDAHALNAEDASKLMAAYRERWGEA